MTRVELQVILDQVRVFADGMLERTPLEALDVALNLRSLARADGIDLSDPKLRRAASWSLAAFAPAGPQTLNAMTALELVGRGLGQDEDGRSEG